MRLAVSNIAWDVEEDEHVAELLAKYRIDAIDIAPGKYFAEPENVSGNEILNVKQWWAGRGIEITGMQGLLFGTAGFNVFGPPVTQNALLRRMGAICRIGCILGARRLVFGAFKNRDRTGFGDEEATNIAVDFFRRLGDKAAAEGVIVCLEPIPACYGANFMVTTAETAALVSAIDHPAIRLQLDVGAMAVNQEDVFAVVSEYCALIGHIHASEPDLAPLGDKGARHGLVADALSRCLPDAIVTIEMQATQSEPHLVSIERAIQTATRAYRGTNLGRMP